MTSDDYMELFKYIISIFVPVAIEWFGIKKREGAWWFCSIVECACFAFIATGLNLLWPISIWFYALCAFVISFACMCFLFWWNIIKEKEKALKAKEDNLEKKEEGRVAAFREKEKALKAKEDSLEKKEKERVAAFREKEKALKAKEEALNLKEREDILADLPDNYYAAITSTSMTPSEYKELILRAEKDAKSILLLPKRLTVMFKSDEMIRDMARKRYGDGSPYVNAYVSEHTERKAAFYSKLDNGCKVYEIHDREELVKYLTKHQNHVGINQVDDNHVIEMLKLWKKAIVQYQDRYHVAFTDEPLPLKYELVDDRKFIIHESAGKKSLIRLNAIFVNSPEFGKRVHEDFFSIWERTDPEYKSSDYIISWIDDMIQQLTSTAFQE